MQNRMAPIWLLLVSVLPSALYSVTEFKPTAANNLTITRQVPRSGLLVTPAFQNPIHPRDLSTTANPQYTIKSSGRYYATADLSQPCSSASNIILLINASNVSLDLNSKTIIPSVSNSLTSGTGIAVAAGLSNILIMNGAVLANDSSGNQRINTGVNLSETAISGGSGTSHSVKLQNLYVKECATSGVYGTGINDLFVSDCTITDGNGNGSVVYGLNLTTVNNLVINNCSFDNNNDPDAQGCVGLYLSDCADGVIENVSACNNSATGANATGIQLATSSFGCSDLKLNNVNASRNNTTGNGTARGLFVSTGSTKLVNITNSTFNGNSATNLAARGADLVSCSNAIILNCQANGNSSQDTTGAGDVIGMAIDTNSYYNTVRDCTANNNLSADNSRTAGFLIDGSYNYLMNCVASRNNNSTTSDFGNANIYGYQIGGSYNQFDGCQAIGNSTAANASVVAAGFYLYNGDGNNSLNKLSNCVANANSASYTGGAVTAAGILISDQETWSQFVNCETANNLVGDGTSSAEGACAYGIYFSNTTGAVQCIVKDCYIAQNSAGMSGSGLAFGLYDNSATSDSLYTGNVAIGQGSCLTNLNSSLQWNDNNQPTVSQNYFFKLPGTGDDPRGAIQEVSRENYLSLSTAVRLWQNVSVYDPSGT